MVDRHLRWSFPMLP